MIVVFTREQGDSVQARSYATVKVDVDGRFIAKYDRRASNEDQGRVCKSVLCACSRMWRLLE